MATINGKPVRCLLDSAGSSDMGSHRIARACGLHNFPKAEVFNTTDVRDPLALQGYKGVPVVVPGLPPIYTEIYETIDSGIYDIQRIYRGNIIYNLIIDLVVPIGVYRLGIKYNF
jgi:hypothetical protein